MCGSAEAIRATDLLVPKVTHSRPSKDVFRSFLERQMPIGLIL